MIDRIAAAAEINDFKRTVNLVRYAREIGYEVVKHKSCAASKCLQHSSGDKIVVARSRDDDHWIYFSLRDPRDKGTIIDFVQARNAGTDLAQVRRVLRDWLGRPEPPASDFHDKVVPTQRDRAAAAAAYHAASRTPNLRHLNERGLRPETLTHPQFADTWRRDPKYGSALFVHRDADGISGFEKKHRNFTGFAGGGEKTFWYSTPRDPVTRLVVTESAIDALSHYQLQPQTNTRYMSFAGELSPRQVVLLQKAAQKLPSSGEVVLAVDRDERGDHFFAKLSDAIASVGVAVRRDSPELAKDWNDVLKAKEHRFIDAMVQLREQARLVRGRGESLER